MKWMAGILAILFITGLAAATVIFSGIDPLHVDIASRLAPSSAAHPFGTDELGRDLLARFFAGTRYTLLVGAATTLIAAILGMILAYVPGLGRVVTILAHVGYIAPRFLLAPRRLRRLIVAILCAATLLPALWLGLALIVVLNAVGVMTVPVLGLVFSVAVAFIVSRGKADGLSSSALTGTIPPVFLWAVCAQSGLDALGLGVRPPQPSWGTLLLASSGSPLTNLAVGLGFLLLVFITLAPDGNSAQRSALQAS